AKVDYTIEDTPGAMTVNVTVETGAHYEIEKVEIEGNDSVPEKTLRKFMVIAKKRIPLLRPNHLTDETLGGDVSAIEGYYQTHGWIAARVEKPRVEDGSKPDRLIVTVAIREGPRARVTRRTLEGNEHVEAKLLEKDLTAKLGEPFNPNTVRADVNNLQAYYHDHGWSSASVRGDYDPSAD